MRNAILRELMTEYEQLGPPTPGKSCAAGRRFPAGARRLPPSWSSVNS